MPISMINQYCWKGSLKFWKRWHETLWLCDSALLCEIRQGACAFVLDLARFQYWISFWNENEEYIIECNKFQLQNYFLNFLNQLKKSLDIPLHRGFECCLAIAAGFSTPLSDFATSATKWYQPVTFFVGPNVSASTTGSTTGEPPEGLWAGSFHQYFSTLFLGSSILALFYKKTNIY